MIRFFKLTLAFLTIISLMAGKAQTSDIKLKSLRYERDTVTCQHIFAGINELQTMPQPDDSGHIRICTSTLIQFSGTATFPQNDQSYHQSDTNCLFIWHFGNEGCDTGQTVTYFFF
ncbi:MAG: hypothetical protein V2A54_07545 [Bacteroidota bacterium]